MKKRIRFSIRTKTIIMILAFALILVEVAMMYFSLVSSSNNKKHYERIASSLSATVAEVVDVNDFKELEKEVLETFLNSKEKPINGTIPKEEYNKYLEQYEYITEMPQFLRMRRALRKIEAANEANEIDCIYLSFVKEYEGVPYCIYVVDTALDKHEVEEEGTNIDCPPGTLDVVVKENLIVLTEPEVGFPPFYTDLENYPSLVTAGTAVFDIDSSGERTKDVIGYSFVDITMSKVRKGQSESIIRLFVYMITTTLLISILGIVIVHFTLVKPVKKLKEVASSYDNQNPEKTHEEFSSFEIKNNDELYDLSISMKKMENDVYNQIAKLTAMNKELQLKQKETKKLSELANKDGLTGVRNKVAYNAIVKFINKEIKKNKNVEFGVVMIDLNDLKIINDKYGHNNGDIALIKLTNIICAIFAHSLVFRIGGDEFVVILKNNDYRMAQELIDEFKQKIEKLSNDKDLSVPERISAAIGYSLYNAEKDNTFEEVFKRSDENMYANKSMMKKKKK